MAAAADPTARIITHMNADHQDSLSRFLEAFSGVSSFGARNAQLSEMTLSTLVLRTSPLAADAGPRAAKDGRYVIALDPPLTSWAQARERLVALDAEATKKLGRDSVTVKEFLVPDIVSSVVIVGVAIIYAVMFRRENLVPGSPNAWYPWSLLGKEYPGFTQRLYDLWPKLFVPLIGSHILEAIYLDYSRLQKHSVPRFGGLWWKFMVTHFFEGFTSFKRFDAYVAKKKAAKKH